MRLGEWLPDGLKLRLRTLLAKAGIEIAAYTGSFAEHRSQIVRAGGVETVWDVGAHIGEYAVQLQTYGYVGRIISIEPSEASFKELAKRADRGDKWIAIAMAVADSVGDRVLNVAANGQSSSLLPMAERHRNASPSSIYVSSQTVKTTTLDALQDHMRPASPFFVKLDIQGGEMAALRGATSVLRSAVACEVELSLAELYEGGATLAGWSSTWSPMAFSMCDFERVFFDHVSGDLLQVNALFRRQPELDPWLRREAPGPASGWSNIGGSSPRPRRRGSYLNGAVLQRPRPG